MSSNFRYYKGYIPKDGLSKTSQLISMATHEKEPKYSNDRNIVAQGFPLNTYLYNLGDVIYKYDGKFTVCFWARFTDKGNIDIAYPNCLCLVMNDGTSIKTELSAQVTDNMGVTQDITYTDWNWYKIQRDDRNNITFSINGNRVSKDKSTALFDLSDASYLFLGTNNKYFTGYEVVVDDILIFEDTTSYLDNVPTDYLDLSKFVKLVYIKTSDNSVWAMRDVGIVKPTGKVFCNLKVIDGELVNDSSESIEIINNGYSIKSETTPIRNTEICVVPTTSLQLKGIDFSSDYTIAFWVKSNIINRWTYVITSADAPSIQLNDYSTSGIGAQVRHSNYYDIATGVSVQANEWVHIALTVDSTNTYRMFVNGELKGSFSDGVHYGNKDGTVFFSAYYQGSPVTLSLDDIVIVQECLFTKSFDKPTMPLLSKY